MVNLRLISHSFSELVRSYQKKCVYIYPHQTGNKLVLNYPSHGKSSLHNHYLFIVIYCYITIFVPSFPPALHFPRHFLQPLPRRKGVLEGAKDQHCGEGHEEKIRPVQLVALRRHRVWVSLEGCGIWAKDGQSIMGKWWFRISHGINMNLWPSWWSVKIMVNNNCEWRWLVQNSAN